MVEMVNFSVSNAYCQYHKEHFQFHKFYSTLTYERAVAVASWAYYRKGPAEKGRGVAPKDQHC